MKQIIAPNLSLATYVGIDAHPSEHTALAMNRFEEEKGQLRFENNTSGIQQCLTWLQSLHIEPNDIIIGIEGGTSTRHRLLLNLAAVYPHLYEVNPLYTRQRRLFGTRGVKSDPVDAKLIAGVLTRNIHDLPKISAGQLASTTRCLQKTVWFYEEITVHAARIKNHLHQLKKENELSASKEERHILGIIIKSRTGELSSIQKQQKKLEKEFMSLLVGQGINLITFPGIGIVSAAKILAYTGGIERFPTVDKFLSYAGIAPKERSSGKSKRYIQNSKGNRRLNTAFYMVALNQLTHNPNAKAYFEKKVAEGKSKKHALRCVMKRTACIVYGMLKSGKDYRG